MMTENFRPTVLRNQAYEALRGKWTPAVVTSLVFCILLGVAVSLSRVNALLYLIAYLGGASIVAIGMLYACWDLFTKGTLPEAGALFAPFKQYARTVGAVLLVFVYTLLWTLLLVIPGIIKAYSYSMTFYILRENPEMTAGDAITASQKMMDGHKMDLFLLSLSFIGWAILASITFGIGYLWLIPYIYTAYAAFYETLKKETSVTPATSVSAE
ncbi:DUF975 family protein [Alistipes indistinctus]|nr:DUF975 family protein [Alistipes indistinctus]MBD9133756.1 DUF975 family protein [Alistipes indistinctus]MBS1440565.1 DUF975 family protein [Alistipes sp.]RGU36764.1 DUF975 family protein [Alistipes indistinctus]